jgi:hypothetical protein
VATWSSGAHRKTIKMVFYKWICVCVFLLLRKEMKTFFWRALDVSLQDPVPQGHERCSMPAWRFQIAMNQVGKDLALEAATPNLPGNHAVTCVLLWGRTQKMMERVAVTHQPRTP